VYQTLKLPLTRPIPDWFLRRTSDNHLLVDFSNMNGIYRAVVLEREGKMRVEEIRNSLWLFPEDTHAAKTGDKQAPPLIRAWAMWSLPAFCASGVYLWLASRPRHRWAWTAQAAGSASFAALRVEFRQARCTGRCARFTCRADSGRPRTY
jgi:hypothetical protein